uniref:Uncharacterized protein n=1 Tax=Trichogramma kaykai TaxID=54128 RepID=A0ABD2WXT8_9HYME
MRYTRQRSILCAPRTDQHSAQKPIYNAQYCVYKSVCVGDAYPYIFTCAPNAHTDIPVRRTTSRRARGELYAAPLYARLAIDEIFAATEASELARKCDVRSV